MRTNEIRDRIKARMKDFEKRDPRKFPQLYIKILSRRRPSGIVYLVRGQDFSDEIDSFNSIAQLGMIVETICKEYRVKTP
jgi:hypothetical protein